MNTYHDSARGLPQTSRTRTSESIRITLATITAVSVMFGVLACGKGDGSGSNGTPAAGTITTSAPQTGADTDHAVAGAGLPAGYTAVFDHSNAKSADVSYSEREPGRWEVKTGPAHILFASQDTAANTYSVSATFEQLEAPAHPEAFGVFIGGSNLQAPTVKYTYFIVRGDGKYMVKVRDGARTRTVADWTANPAIPKQDSAGKGLYGIKIDVKDGVASVIVNGAPITTLSGKDVPLNGIAGVRINHNLHLMVTPVSVIR